MPQTISPNSSRPHDNDPHLTGVYEARAETVNFAILPFFSVVSALVCLIIVYAGKRIPKLAGRSGDLAAVQAMHERRTPRVGGIAIFIAFLISCAFVPLSISDAYLKFALATSFLFLVGLMEDLGLHVTPRMRLFACFLASFIAILLLGVWLPRIGIPSFDPLMATWTIGIPVTLLITAAVANGFNLIDGVHGLAAIAAVAAAIALAGIASQAGYFVMTEIALILTAGILGFLVFNYPFGWIFLGDAGAYTLGFILSWFGISVLINSPSVSPWAILLTVFWPLADALLAIFRRIRQSSLAMAPDKLHVHQMVMRSLEIYFLGRHRRQVSNPLTTLILAPFVLAPPVTGVLLWDQNKLAFFAVLSFLTLFFMSYRLAISVLRRRPRRSGCSTPTES